MGIYVAKFRQWTTDDSRYDETVDRLVEDPVIKQMAAELWNDWIDASGGGRMHPWNPELTLPALQMYIDRGGQVQGHIGGPIGAVRRLCAKRLDEYAATIDQLAARVDAGWPGGWSADDIAACRANIARMRADIRED